MRIRVLIGLVLLLTMGLALPASAQTVPQQLIWQWEIDGPPALSGGARPPFSVEDAQGYPYKSYVVGSATGVLLMGVTCTTTADAFIKTCSALVPTAQSAPGMNLDLTATVGGIESAHSTPAVVPPLILPPTAPRNPRLLRSVITQPTG